MWGKLLVATAITGAIAAWMVTGDLVVSGAAQDAARRPPAERSVTDAAPFRVRVATLTAVDRPRVLEMRGRTRADALVSVAAETTGRVERRPVSRGQRVEPGEILCELDRGVREAEVARARADAERAALEFNAASQLRGRGFESETRVATTRASLDAAHADVAAAEQELARVVIRAPIAGVVHEPLTDTGATLAIGDVCATLVDKDPLFVIGQVSERNIQSVTLGAVTDVELVTGETATGYITFISSTADQATRTFTVEVEIPNADGRLRDGVTANAFIPVEPVKVHRLSPGVLTLDDAGEVGIRMVDADDRVAFRKVSIAMQDADGFWVTGLPDTVTVITVGQDYVVDGQIVDPVPASDEGA